MQSGKLHYLSSSWVCLVAGCRTFRMLLGLLSFWIGSIGAAVGLIILDFIYITVLLSSSWTMLSQREPQAGNFKACSGV
jgi:hypothetical protein